MKFKLVMKYLWPTVASFGILWPSCDRFRVQAVECDDAIRENSPEHHSAKQKAQNDFFDFLADIQPGSYDDIAYALEQDDGRLENLLKYLSMDEMKILGETKIHGVELRNFEKFERSVIASVLKQYPNDDHTRFFLNILGRQARPEILHSVRQSIFPLDSNQDLEQDPPSPGK